MRVLSVGSLFTGIGGFDLGFERAGYQIKWQVEINEFCQKILTKHWPEVPKFKDIKKCGRHNLKTVDVICGGDPCQPFSVAGKRMGKKDDRYLWPEMFRIIRELKPSWVINENVDGSANMVLDQKISDLESEGYEVQAFCLPACAVNAPHQRNRIWVIGYTCGIRRNGEPRSFPREEFKDRHLQIEQTVIGDASFVKRKRYISNRQSSRKGRTADSRDSFRENWVEVATSLCRVDDGVPDRVDRIKTLGNSVVPQLVEVIAKIIKELEK